MADETPAAGWTRRFGVVGGCVTEANMSLHCPSLVWPDQLEELGPVEDPTILLRGIAQVGAAQSEVQAIRVDPDLRLTPDYRDDVDQACYADLELEARLDDLASIGGTDRPAMVQLATGAYVLYLVPCEAEC